MAFQLIYTSAARLLDAGRSGFGTVARSRGIPALAAGAIERFSQFANLRDTDRSRIILAHRRVTAGSHRFHVLSQIRGAGSDYTGRTNHIAHHLVFTLEEVARAEAAGLTPTDIMRKMPWRDEWNEPARYFEASADVPLEAFPALARQSGREAWIALTGQPGHARLLAWDGAPRNGLLLFPENAPALALLGEALAETGRHAWSRTFTTSLEGTDDTADFDWILATPTTFPSIQNRCGSRPVIDTTHPSSLPLPPEVIAPAPTQTEPAARQPTRAPDIATRAHGTTYTAPAPAKATGTSAALRTRATLARKPSGSHQKALFAVLTGCVVAIAIAAIYLKVISPMQAPTPTGSSSKADEEVKKPLTQEQKVKLADYKLSDQEIGEIEAMPEGQREKVLKYMSELNSFFGGESCNWTKPPILEDSVTMPTLLQNYPKVTEELFELEEDAKKGLLNLQWLIKAQAVAKTIREKTFIGKQKEVGDDIFKFLAAKHLGAIIAKCSSSSDLQAVEDLTKSWATENIYKEGIATRRSKLDPSSLDKEKKDESQVQGATEQPQQPQEVPAYSGEKKEVFILKKFEPGKIDIKSNLLEYLEKHFRRGKIRYSYGSLNELRSKPDLFDHKTDEGFSYSEKLTGTSEAAVELFQVTHEDLSLTIYFNSLPPIENLENCELTETQIDAQPAIKVAGDGIKNLLEALKKAAGLKVKEIQIQGRPFKLIEIQQSTISFSFLPYKGPKPEEIKSLAAALKKITELKAQRAVVSEMKDGTEYVWTPEQRKLNEEKQDDLAKKEISKLLAIKDIVKLIDDVNKIPKYGGIGWSTVSALEQEHMIPLLEAALASAHANADRLSKIKEAIIKTTWGSDDGPEIKIQFRNKNK